MMARRAMFNTSIRRPLDIESPSQRTTHRSRSCSYAQGALRLSQNRRHPVSAVAWDGVFSLVRSRRLSPDSTRGPAEQYTQEKGRSACLVCEGTMIRTAFPSGKYLTYSECARAREIIQGKNSGPPTSCPGSYKIFKRHTEIVELNLKPNLRNGCQMEDLHTLIFALSGPTSPMQGCRGDRAVILACI